LDGKLLLLICYLFLVRKWKQNSYACLNLWEGRQGSRLR